MAFYGNITNTSRTQFQFDKIYPNKYTMEKNMRFDGVYLNRYVLIEYSADGGLDTFILVLIKDNKYYYNPKGSTGFVTLLTKALIDVGEIVYEDTDNGYQFYKCTSSKVKGSTEPATFNKINKTNNKSNYSSNYFIDTELYNEPKGYDSTVWQKVYVTKEGTDEKEEKYVNIAELNTVVPTFNVSPDAPTMNPIVPHFDTNSTNVHYNLHWLAPWGFRVAEAKNNKSDETTTWTTYKYNEDANTHSSSAENKAAAIYYNKAGFKERIPSKDNQTINEIKVTPTGKSGNKYNKHNGTSDLEEAEDIQELTINLPAIGNMMSDAWDIIHGPNRDDARTDENGSLLGRLDSFKDMNVNAIPVKRNTDGTLVGSYINGNTSKHVTNILEERLSESFDSDDAWIKTSINTIGLDNNNDLSGISIHHAFHSVDNTETTADKNNNTGNGNNKGQGDTLNLYTPYIDAAGHVVGKNIETVTLPFGFKYIKTNGSNTATANPSANTNTIEADNTQDTMDINTANKWIRIANSNNTMTIGHEVHTITTSDKSQTDLNDGTDTITIQDTAYDAAGHVTVNLKHTYVLPYGFKTIKTNGRGNTEETENASSDPITTDIVADKTQDDLTINSGNKWIRIDSNASTDSLTISHDIHNTSSTTSELSLSSETAVTTFEVPTYSFDKAGHYISHDTKTITMPFGYGKINGDNGNTEASATFDTLTFGSDEWLTATVEKDKIIYNHDYPKEQEDTTSSFDMNNDINNTIVLETLNHDDKGHIINVNLHTVTLPYGYKEFRDSNIEVGKSIANNTQDIFVFKGDSWIKPTVSTDLATFEHIGPVSKVHTSKTNIELKFGETFVVEDHYFDDNGHKYSTETHTVLLPKGSLTDNESNGADVITKLSFVEDTGALSSTRTNISELLLTGYEKKDNSNDINNADTLAQALSKLLTQIHEEEKDRAADIDGLRTDLDNEIIRADGAEKQVLIDAKAYTDKVKQEILTGESSEELKETYDTLLEIAQWIEGDGVNATELTTAIAEETKAREENIADINIRIDNLPTYVLSPGETNGSLKLNNSEDIMVTGLGSAAYTDSASYATAAQGALAETALLLDTEFSISDGDDSSMAVATIPQLFAYIRDLLNQVNLLSEEVNRLSAFHPIEDESENI